MVHRRVYRSISTVRSAVVSTVGAIAFGVVGVIPGNAQIFCAGFAVVLVLMAWRYWNLGVHLEAGGVKLFGFFRSTRVSWESIDRFDVLPRGIYPYVAHLIRNDGHQPMPVMGLGAPARPKSRLESFRSQVQRPVDELNRVLAERR